MSARLKTFNAAAILISTSSTGANAMTTNAFERAARARKVALLVATIDLLTSEGLGDQNSRSHAEAVRKTFASSEADRWWSIVERVADVHPASAETRRQVLAVYEQRARHAAVMGVLPGGVS